MSSTLRLAEFVADAGSIPADIEAAAIDVLVDTVACAFSGHSVSAGAISARFAAKSAGTSTIIGFGQKASLDAAVFANAQLMNAADLDEVLMNWGHQAPYTVPVGLGVAEARGATGPELLRAIAIGFEIGARVSHAVAGPVRALGEPPHLRMETLPVAGFSANIFGSVAAAAVLMKLKPDQIRNAFGIAAYLSPVPSSAHFATLPNVPMTKYGLAGWIAKSGLTAALLAEDGFTGPATALDDETGYARMIGSVRFSTEDMLSGLGSNWWIAKTSFKEYPNCRFIHPALDIVSQLVSDNGIGPDSIRSIEVALLARAAGSPAFATVDIPSDIDAQFRIPYAVAACVYGKHRFPDLLLEATRNDPRILDMARKVVLSPEPRQVELRYQVHGNEPVGPIEYAPTTVTLRTDGGVFSGTSDTATGDPWDPVRRLNSVDLLNKLECCASSIIGVRNSIRLRDYLVNIHKRSIKNMTHVLRPENR